MFSVRRGHASTRSTAGLAEGVLPRVLRKPARFLGRLFAGDVEAPRHATPALLAGLFCVTGVYGAYLGGHVPDIVSAVTARSGFAVTQIRINGNRDTSEIDIIGAIGLDGHTSMVGLDLEAARSRVEELPWVQSATLRKVYPDAIEVQIDERRPFAVWQREGALVVIERDGRPIAPFGGTRHAALPLIVGADAPALAPAFVEKVAAHESLAEKVIGYVRIGGRRWDLRIENGVTVRLPEFGETAALAELARLDAEEGILSADIVEIDMRLADRIAVRLSPRAAEARAELVKERLKPRRTERQT